MKVGDIVRIKEERWNRFINTSAKEAVNKANTNKIFTIENKEKYGYTFVELDSYWIWNEEGLELIKSYIPEPILSRWEILDIK